MSWSVSSFGRAGSVQKQIADQFEKGGKCSEPEESIRQSAKETLDKALGSFDPTLVVEVNAVGSMTYRDWNNKTGVSNSLTISIVPKYGFLE